MNPVIAALRSRSSTRSYTDRPLSEDVLDALLQAGLQAPTAINRQEIHFTLVPGSHPILRELEAEKNRLRGLPEQELPFWYGAPAVILVSADRDFKWGTLDAGIAVENMAVAAESLGLGSVIIGCIADAMHGEKQAYFADALRLPENYEFRIALAVGYKAAGKEPHTYDPASQITRL